MASPSALERLASMSTISDAMPLNSRAYANVDPTLPVPTTATRAGCNSSCCVVSTIVFPGGDLSKLMLPCTSRAPLTLIYFPITLAVVPHLQEPVPGIVPLPAARANQIAAPVRALLIIFFRNRKRGSATARDEKHARTLFLGVLHSRIALRHWTLVSLYDSSTAASALFFRLFACSTFLRKRKNFGVTSTNSSSVMNSMACSRFN